MKSPTFWMLLVGLVITWRMLAGLGASVGGERVSVRSGEFDFYVIHSEKPVLVSFAAESSGPCKRVAPVVRRVGQSLRGKAAVFVVDVDKHPELAQKYGILSLPALQIFKDGEVVETMHSAEESTLRARLLAHAG